MPGLGTLTVYLNANSSGLERGIASATSMLKKFAAGAAAYLGANALRQQIHESLTLMSVQEQAERALSRTLAASTKTINGSAGQLKQWAADMQSVSTFGDEKLIQAQTRLLEMNSVAGEAFDRARAAAVDIAAQKGEDVTAVMQRLGAAMQDPLKAFKQLRDYGVDQSLRQEVEARIAAGDKEAAQIILLTDLQKRYAGAAEEAADTYTGRLTQVQNAVGDLKEAIGYVIEEIFGVKDGLKSTADTIGEWAAVLRGRAREIGFAFRSVWIDIQAGANELWLAIKPVIDQVTEVVNTSISNLKALFTGNFSEMRGPDYSLFGREMQSLGANMIKIEEERTRAQNALVENLAKKEELARREDSARTVKTMAKAVEEGTVAADAKIKTNAVAAELGSTDAWRIITAAALTGKAAGSTPAASAPSAVSAAPASSPRDDYLASLRAQAKSLAADAKFTWTMPAAPQRKDTSQILANGTWTAKRIWDESAWWEKPMIAAELARQGMRSQTGTRVLNALSFSPLAPMANAAQLVMDPRGFYDRVSGNVQTAWGYGKRAAGWISDKVAGLFGGGSDRQAEKQRELEEKQLRVLAEIQKNTARAVANPANLRR